MRSAESLGGHDAFVGEQAKRGVHRPGGGLPAAVRALGDLADDLVAVHRLFVKKREDGGADVSLPMRVPTRLSNWLRSCSIASHMASPAWDALKPPCRECC
ncbi:hypothetical protein GCM10025876_37800 [Demequina litorisediminis]|uniref:Uncharacterized protein n=1 Tax=Demequina litorisediminis TaxID=1849022 RepID=A0ABQ6IKF5_9MICO|nr:hypothetical protein GCM10025876_37800 [Demequina litorisediminis]